MSKYDIDYETYCPQYPHMREGMYDIYLQIVEEERSMLEWRVRNKLAQQEREVEANAVSSQTVALTHSHNKG